MGRDFGTKGDDVMSIWTCWPKRVGVWRTGQGVRGWPCRGTAIDFCHTSRYMLTSIGLSFFLRRSAAEHSTRKSTLRGLLTQNARSRPTSCVISSFDGKSRAILHARVSHVQPGIALVPLPASGVLWSSSQDSTSTFLPPAPAGISS